MDKHNRKYFIKSFIEKLRIYLSIWVNPIKHDKYKYLSMSKTTSITNHKSLGYDYHNKQVINTILLLNLKQNVIYEIEEGPTDKTFYSTSIIYLNKNYLT